MLSVNNWHVGYGESIVVRDMSLLVQEGQIACLMGKNGVGKSTLIKSIMGLLKPSQGQLTFANQDITYLPTEKRARLGIGYVPQGREIFPQLTVEDNLILGLEAKRTGGKKRIPEEIFDLFPALKDILPRRGGDLSGGQQQQLAIARALMSDPQILILDEPTEGIQPSIVLQIAETIHEINKTKNVTILLVEQKIEFAMELADIVYVMEKGKIILQGEKDKLGEEVIREHLLI